MPHAVLFRILSFFAAAGALAVTAACGDGGTTEPDAPIASVASVSVSPPAASLVPGQTSELAATPRDGSNTPLAGRAVTWSSDDAAVATVTNAGVVTGEGPGTTTIRARSEGREGTAQVTVADGGFVGANGGTVSAAQGGVVLTVPAGAVGSGTALTVNPVTNPPPNPQLINGTAYELGPAGTTFAQPVTVQIQYSDAALNGADENWLTVQRWDGQAWAPLDNGAVDAAANTVSGETSQFSPFAVIEIVPNPEPTLTSIEPTTAEEGGTAFTLTVTGTGFVETSEILWNGDPRPTTHQSATLLTAQIAAVDIETAGEAAVSVRSPAPGGGTTPPLAFAILPPQSTFTVTTTADAGAGSLREAILAANANPGADLVHFDIPGAGPHAITPLSALPAVSDPVTIDGLTQPGAACSSWPATLQIEIRGNAAGGGQHGLQLSASNSTVRGLVINRFPDGAAILLNSDANTVACTYLGTDVAGTTAVGAPFDKSEYGILVDGGDGNIIGGASPSDRNLISNSDEDGIRLRGGATGNVIAGNFIGTDVDGDASLENGNSGVYVIGAPANRIGGPDHDAGVCNHSCNLISGNDDNGIEVWGDGGDATVIQGNFIGVALDGTTALPNEDNGVIIDMGAGSVGHADHVIGGRTEPGVCQGPCNLISGNADSGVRIDDRTVVDVTIQGNFLGTDITGTVALGNGDYGIKSDGNRLTVGGGTPGLGNLISANVDGGLDLGGNHEVVQGNLIGTSIDGTSPLGNAGHGIFLTESDNVVGGRNAGEGNTIAHNGLHGVFHSLNTGAAENARNAFLGNAIYGNGGLGINLCVVVAFSCDGVTPNDPDDTDDGANRLQNYPVLSTATLGGMLAVSGALDSTPSTTFRIEFFGNGALDGTGNGEGQVYLGFAEVTTDENGDAAIAAELSTTGVSAGDFITTTATDSEGNTSEFSAGVEVRPGG